MVIRLFAVCQRVEIKTAKNIRYSCEDPFEFADSVEDVGASGFPVEDEDREVTERLDADAFGNGGDGLPSCINADRGIEAEAGDALEIVLPEGKRRVLSPDTDGRSGGTLGEPPEVIWSVALWHGRAVAVMDQIRDTRAGVGQEEEGFLIRLCFTERRIAGEIFA